MFSMMAAVLAVAAHEPMLRLEPLASAAARYERIEFAIRGVPACGNPYDRLQADVRLVVRTPGGDRTVMPAYYAEPFELGPRRRGDAMVDWVYPSGASGWRARFAPKEVGSHTLTAMATVGGRTLQSQSVRLAVKASKNPGFVRVSRRDPRFFELDDGSPFFAVGQNVAFIKDVHETRGILRKLAANGANFVRIWTCCEDWGMAIEARKSAWARSWDWKPPFADDPAEGKCVRLSGPAGVAITANPTQRMGLKPSTRYRLTATVWSPDRAKIAIEIAGARHEWETGATPAARTFEFEAGPQTWWLETVRLSAPNGGTAYVRGLSLKETASGREILWDADPNRPVLGTYNQTDCTMLDAVVEEAERSGIRLQLCVLTRDLYMDRLKDPASPEYDRAIADAKNLLRYAVARWGYSTAVAAWEYWNEMDPGRPTGRFYDELGKWLEATDPHRRPRTTSAWSDAPDDWRHAKIDVANMHWYLRPAEGAFYTDEVAAVQKKARQLRDAAPDKPALFAEFGLAQDNWQPSPDMRADPAYVHLHNALWASALSGLSGTVMAWWWEDIDARDACRRYRGVSAFVARVPWTSGRLKAADASVAGDRWRVIGLATNNAAYAWVQDPRAVRTKRAPNGDVTDPSSGVTLRVGGLRAGSYRVEWVDTLSGKTVRTDSARSADGELHATAPTFMGDIACAIEQKAGEEHVIASAAKQ